MTFRNENVTMSRMEEIHMRKETNNLRKQDQKEKMEEIKIQRQMEMLKVQAKHFGIEAKRNLRKVSFDHQIQKNVHTEQSMKNQINAEESGRGFKMKSERHLEDVKNLAAKLIAQNQKRGQPTGLRTLS